MKTPLPPDVLADALQARVHLTSGRLLASKSINPTGQTQMKKPISELKRLITNDELLNAMIVGGIDFSTYDLPFQTRQDFSRLAQRLEACGELLAELVDELMQPEVTNE